jgi:hypothetical protein
VTFRIDPAAAEQVSAITDTGATLQTYWETGFVPGSAVDRVIRDPAGTVVVADGDDLPVGERLHGYFVCFAPASIYVLLTNPAGG